MRSLMALEFWWYLDCLCRIVFQNRNLLFQNQKYHSFYVPLHQNLLHCLRGTFSPDSIACLAFFAIDLAIIGYLMLQSALVYNRQIVE